MKYGIVILWMLLSVCARANKINCESTSAQVLDFLRKPFEPKYNQSCSEKQIPDSCQNLKNRLQIQNQNWKSYLLVCEPESYPVTDYLLPCAGIIESILTELRNNVEQQFQNQKSNQLCSSDIKNKKFLIDHYNQGLPAALRFDQPALVDKMLQKDCREISSFLSAYLREQIQRSLLQTPATSDVSVLSERQKEFLKWREGFLKTSTGENKSQSFREILNQTATDFSCLNRIRQAEMICDAVLMTRAAQKTFTGGSRTSQIVQQGLTDKERKKLIEKIDDLAYQENLTYKGKLVRFLNDQGQMQMAYVQGVTRDSYILKIKNAQDQVQIIHVSTRAEVMLAN